MVKKLMSLFIIFTLLFSNIIYAEEFPIKPFDGFEGTGEDNDASKYDWTGKEELLYTLEFESDTIWPNDSKMPETFTKEYRDKIMEYGEDPGLGIKELHEMGFTGRGVSIAFVDKALLINHNEYKDRDIKYYKINPENKPMETSSHGPGMLSIMSGKNVGIAPDAHIYFVGRAYANNSQKNEAAAFKKLIEINKMLPENQKIRVIGIAHCVDERLKDHELLEEAIMEAERNGIMVVDVTTFNQKTATCLPFKDKDNPNNYIVPPNFADSQYEKDVLFVPTGGKKIAYGDYPDNYFYQTNSGVSSTVPVLVGVLALGFQADPNLTKEKAIQYIYESGYKFNNGKLLNPKGFVELVLKNRKDKTFDKIPGDRDFYYLLYNKNYVTSEDYKAIQDYIDKFKKEFFVVKDVSDYKTAREIYDFLKKDYSQNKYGKLKGIQIIGIPDYVPAFDVHFEIQNENGIDDRGNFKTDFFYTNFDSDSKYLIDEEISIYKSFKEELDVSYIPKWPVKRLPLLKGEIAPFIHKFFDYANQIRDKNIPYVNFSSPIFPNENHIDDMGYFIFERLYKEFNFLSTNDYRLYGNKYGLFPVKTNVTGNFDRNNLELENKREIIHFITNSHGQSNNIDNCIFVKKGSIPSDIEIREIRERDDLIELRASLINSDNINKVLSYNYYTFINWGCSVAWELNEENITHEALANGLLVDSIAASSLLSNNGINNKAKLDEMKNNNSYYFFYNFFANIDIGKTRSESFHLARREYAKAVLQKSEEGNYQYNLHNVLSLNHLGLFEYWEPTRKQLRLFDENEESNKNLSATNNDSIENKIINRGKCYGINYILQIKSNQKSVISNVDDNIDYCNIPYSFKEEDKRYKVNFVGAAVDEFNVYIKVKYYTPEKKDLFVFLQGDEPGLKEMTNKTQKGNNTVIIKLKKDDIKNFETGLAIDIGCDNSICIEKGLLDYIAEYKEDIKVMLNNEYIKTMEKPKICDGIILIPIRPILERLGFCVSWDSTTRTVIGQKKGLKIQLPVNEVIAKKNNTEIVLDNPTIIINGTTMVSIKFIEDCLGMNVIWDENSTTVIMTMLE